MAARRRTTSKLLPLASSTKRSSVVVCCWAQLQSCWMGILLKTFSVIAAAGVGPRSNAAVKESGWESKPITRPFVFASFSISVFIVHMMVVQADGNGLGDYMHSGMRGGPHIGAFRRCSFTGTESNSKEHRRASPVIPLLVSSQQVIRSPYFRPSCNLLPEFFRT